MEPLHVEALHLVNFARHRDTSVRFPARGIVLVTGDNGSGKTTLLDAVATGVWGRSTGKRSPWRAGEAGSVEITTRTLDIRRTYSASKRQTLRAVPLGAADPEAESRSKAEELLSERLGDFDVWLRQHVFKSGEGARFAEAKDADRKRFLEQLLGLEVFDPALSRMKDALREAKGVLAGLTSSLPALESSVATLRGVVEGAGEFSDPSHLSPLRDALAAAEAALEAARFDAQAATLRRTNARVQTQTLQAEVQRLHSALSGKGPCPTCGQDRGGVDDSLREALQTARAAYGEALEVQSAFERAEREVLGRVSKATTDHQAEAFRLQKFENRLEEEAARRTQVDRARTDLAEKEALLSALREEIQVAEHNVIVREACVQVLGLKGARTSILSRALPFLSDRATLWMRALGRAWAISLAPTTTRQSGNVVEEIALHIEGPEAPNYDSLSGGEQKRVILALLLALGDLGSACSGSPLGTLWFDEALDAPLDAQGAADAARALRSLAETRCVVVIAHSPDVASVLHPDVHWHLTGGEVTVLRGTP